jgi:hypothetical protein
MRLYICPTPGCGNYYGSSSMPDLSRERKYSITHRPSGTRDECPDCKAEGRTVRRELREVVVR